MRGFGDKQTTPMPFEEASAIAKKGEAEYGGKPAAEGSGSVKPAEPEEPDIEKVEAKAEPEPAAEPEPVPDPDREPAVAARSSGAMKIVGPLLVLLFAVALIGGTLFLAGKL